jgi:AcrR family transcriptional regulator
MSQSSGAAPRVRNARGQGTQLREELVRSAAHLLGTLDQPEALSLRQVARAAGVAPASIYDHFPDLGALFENVLELRYAELADLMRAADLATRPLERLVARCRVYIEWADAHPGDYRTLFGGRVPAGVPASVVAHRSGTELLRGLTAALAAATDPDNALSDAVHSRAGLLLWTAMHGLVNARAEHPNLPWPPDDLTMADLLALHTHLPAGQISALLATSPVEAASPSDGMR